MDNKIYENIRDLLRNNMVEASMMMSKIVGMKNEEVAGIVSDLLDGQAMEMYKLTRSDQDAMKDPRKDLK